MAAAPHSFANIAAEEGEDWRALGEHPAVRSLAGLFEALFVPEPAFDWLADEGALFAWLNTEEAEREAAARGARLAGAPAAVVQHVHDKAFALEVARRERLLPAALSDCIRVFEPGQLEDGEAVLAEIEREVARWPAWMDGRFTLKPRLGSSGRGRVGRRDGVAGALPRLRARGGAILEPWLERTQDLSAQLYLAPNGALTLVGTSELRVSSTGVYRGQRGRVDARGRVATDSRHDGALREAAAAVAGAAAREGYHGPCGLDAFAYRGPDGREELRAVVELNARFTSGHVALGHLRRNHSEVRQRLSLSPDHPAAFLFALASPADGWPEMVAPVYRLPLPEDGPLLLVAPEPGDLDAALGSALP